MFCLVRLGLYGVLQISVLGLKIITIEAEASQKRLMKRDSVESGDSDAPPSDKVLSTLLAQHEKSKKDQQHKTQEETTKEGSTTSTYSASQSKKKKNKKPAKA